MTTVLNIVALAAAAVVPFWLALFIYGRVQRSRHKGYLPGAEPLNSGEEHASGADSGGDGGGDGGSH